MPYSNWYEYRAIARLLPEEQYLIQNELEILDLFDYREQFEQQEKP